MVKTPNRGLFAYEKSAPVCIYAEIIEYADMQEYPWICIYVEILSEYADMQGKNDQICSYALTPYRPVIDLHFFTLIVNENMNS